MTDNNRIPNHTVENKLPARADDRAVFLQLAKNLDQARRFLLAGVIRTASGSLIKPGAILGKSIELVIHDPRWADVGRGAAKARPVFACFAERINNAVTMDVGASTGGFTQVLLEMNAHRVFAVDVGRGLLVPDLLRDERVSLCDRCNFRHGPPLNTAASIDVLVADISFLSLLKLMVPIRQALAPGGIALLLVKPQFELPRSAVPEGGVVDTIAGQFSAVERVWRGFSSAGYTVSGTWPAGVPGRRGNQEYFLCATLS